MTIFTRDLSFRIVLVYLLLLPYVTSQQEPGSKVRAESVIGIVLLALFLSSILGGCLFYIFHRHSSENEARGHEVWHSGARRGLDKDVIESFPFFLYSEVKGLKIGKGGVECAICLNEFEDEEKLRWMPPCKHTFHASCIDVWLSSRSTCPVCRENMSLKPGETSTDLETGNGQNDVQESHDDISLRGNSAGYRTPRSRSTGFLSSWRMAEISLPRSHSSGHSLVQLGENLDRYTLQLPEEVQRQLVSLDLTRRSHMDLPQARSSIQSYRSSSVGSERSGSSKRRQTLPASLSFSFQAASVWSTHGNNVRETSQARDIESGERSFARLMPEKV